MPDSDYERTLYEARLDTRYYELFHSRNARFFRHLRDVLSIVSLVAGTAAFTLIVQLNAAVGAAAGAMIAIVTILNYVIDPSARVVKHEHLARAFARLNAEGRGLELEAFDARLASICAEDHMEGIVALRYIAYNDNVIAAGRESYIVPLTRWQQFLAGLA